MNILETANEIVNHRSEEADRQYGPFGECMERTARIASNSTGKEITPNDCYMVLVALKLARHSFNYKEDNLLDAVAYLGALNNYINDIEPEPDKKGRICYETEKEEETEGKEEMDYYEEREAEDRDSQFENEIEKSYEPLYIKLLRYILKYGQVKWSDLYDTKPNNNKFTQMKSKAQRESGIKIKSCDKQTYNIHESSFADLDLFLSLYDKEKEDKAIEYKPRNCRGQKAIYKEMLKIMIENGNVDHSDIYKDNRENDTRLQSLSNYIKKHFPKFEIKSNGIGGYTIPFDKHYLVINFLEDEGYIN